jgi:AcrR family transcriptional regulator
LGLFAEAEDPLQEVDPAPLTGKAATQDRILEAATQLFLDRGFDATTVAQVAETAGVSRATVFWHFSDKKSLFREAFSRLVSPFRDSIERDRSDLPPVKRLQEQINAYDFFMKAEERTILGFVQWAVGEEDFRDTVITTLLDLHQRYTGAVTSTIADIVPPGVAPEPLAVGLITLLDGNLLLSLFDPSERRGDARRLAVDAIAALIPRRDDVDS